jgi:putative transposase
MNTVLAQRPARLPLARACNALGLNRSTVYAHQKRAANDEPPRRSRKLSVQPRALSAQERATVVKTLHSEPYCDQPPAEVYQRLLERDQYLCSVSTMHRILRRLGSTSPLLTRRSRNQMLYNANCTDPIMGIFELP